MRVLLKVQAHCLAVGFFALIPVLSAGCAPDTPQESRPGQAGSLATGASETPASDSARLPFSQPVNRSLRLARASDWFRDVTADSGLNFTYRDGSESGCYQLLESVGGGVSAIDFDQDGWQDLCFAGGGAIHRQDDSLSVSGRFPSLYRNSGGTILTDVTELCGLQAGQLYTHGTLSTDIDGDGFFDLVIAGYRGLQVWWNSGDGSFLEVSSRLGIVSDRWNVTVAAGDVDRDALVDLYVLTYADWKPDLTRVCYNDRQLKDICGPTGFSGIRDLLLKSHGQGFHDVTDQAQLIAGNRGLGVIAADIDQNGHLDFFVVNDVEENLLYLNSGAFPLKEDGVLTGVAYSSTGQREGSMGVDLGDFDEDGLADLWYTNYSHQDNSLLRNENNSGFLHYADIAGLSGVSRKWVGFGTGFGDFDCDGWPDLYVINGHVAYERLDSPYFQPPQLFRNDRGSRFVDVTDRGGAYFEHPRSGRGAACIDWNNDGSPDLVVVHQNEPAALLHNQIVPKSWIRIRLIAKDTERTATGAKVAVKTGERTLTQWRISGGSYLSGNDRRLLFSLPDDEPVTVTVTWLGGMSQTHRLSPGNYTIVEGDRASATP